jgi:uncharacterized protein
MVPMLLALVILLAVAVVALTVGCRSHVVPPVPTQHVTDRAGMLTPETRSILETKLEVYKQQTGHEVIVWTDRLLPRHIPIETFAEAAFSGWGIGRKGASDGVALFLFADDRQMRIEVGVGLTGRLGGIERSRIINSTMKPRLRAGTRDEAVTTGVDEILRTIGDPR